MEYGLKHRITAMILMVCLFFNQCGLVAFANEALEGAKPDAMLTIMADDDQNPAIKDTDYIWAYDTENNIDYEGKILYILSDKPMTISQDNLAGEVNNGIIFVVKGTKANITLDNVNIQSHDAALYIEGAQTEDDGTVIDSAELTLTVTGENTLKSAGVKAGIELNDSNAKITIKGDSDAVLNAYGDGGGAGIGGAHQASGGQVIIAGDLTINAEGGAVMEESSKGEDGTQYYTIAAQGDGIGAGAQADADTTKGTFDIEAINQPIVNVTSMDSSLLTEGVTSGMIFNGYQGTIYGDTFTRDISYSIPDGKMLVVEDGEILTVAKDTTLTIPENSQMIISGTVALAEKTVVEPPQDSQGISEPTEEKAGTIVNNGEVTLTENATLTIPEGATFTNEGTLSLAEDVTIDVPTGATFTNNGTINLAAGAEIDGTVSNGENGTIEKETELTFKITEKTSETDPTPDLQTATEEPQKLDKTGTYVIETTVTADSEAIDIEESDITVYYKFANEADSEYQELILSSGTDVVTGEAGTTESKALTQEFFIGTNGGISVNGSYDIKVVYEKAVAEANAGTEYTYKNSEDVQTITVNASELPNATITTLSITNDNVGDGKASEGDTLTLTATVTEQANWVDSIDGSSTTGITGTVEFTIAEVDESGTTRTTTFTETISADVDANGEATAKIKIAAKPEEPDAGTFTGTETPDGYIWANGTYTITATYTDDNSGADYETSSASQSIEVTGFEPETPEPPAKATTTTLSIENDDNEAEVGKASEGDTLTLTATVKDQEATPAAVTSGSVTFTIAEVDESGTTRTTTYTEPISADVDATTGVATATIKIDAKPAEPDAETFTGTETPTGYIWANGTYTITATYNGDTEGGYNESTSASQSIEVTGFEPETPEPPATAKATTTTLSITNDGSAVADNGTVSKEDTLTLKATVTETDDTTAAVTSGSVTFTIAEEVDDGSGTTRTTTFTEKIENVTVTNGVATATIKIAEAPAEDNGAGASSISDNSIDAYIEANGTYTITATYTPATDNADYATSTSEVKTITVDGFDTTTPEPETPEPEVTKAETETKLYVTGDDARSDKTIATNGDTVLLTAIVSEKESTDSDGDGSDGNGGTDSITEGTETPAISGSVTFTITETETNEIALTFTKKMSEVQVIDTTTESTSLTASEKVGVMLTPADDIEKYISANGEYTITAKYEGDDNYEASTSEEASLSVSGFDVGENQIATSMTFVALDEDNKSITTATGETDLTLQATIVDSDGEAVALAEGDVTITDASGTSLVVTIDATDKNVAKAEFSFTDAMKSDTYVFTASYKGTVPETESIDGTTTETYYLPTTQTIQLKYISDSTEPEEEEEKEDIGDGQYKVTIVKDGYFNGGENDDYPSYTENKTVYTFDEGEKFKLGTALATGVLNLIWVIVDDKQREAFLEANKDNASGNMYGTRSPEFIMPACNIEIGSYIPKTLYLDHAKILAGETYTSIPTSDNNLTVTTNYQQELTIAPNYSDSSYRFEKWLVTGEDAVVTEFKERLDGEWNDLQYQEDLTFRMPDGALTLKASWRTVEGHLLTLVNASASPSAYEVTAPFTVTEGDEQKLYGVVPNGVVTKLNSIVVLPSSKNGYIDANPGTGITTVTMPSEDITVVYNYVPDNTSDLLKVEVKNGYISAINTSTTNDTRDYSYQVGQSVAYLPYDAKLSITSQFDTDHQHNIWSLESGSVRSGFRDGDTASIVSDIHLSNQNVVFNASGKEFTPSLSFGMLANGNNQVASAEILTVNGVDYSGSMNSDGAYEITAGSTVTILGNTDLNPNITTWTVTKSDPSGAITSSDIQDGYYSVDTATNPSAKNWAQFIMPKAHIELTPTYNTSTATLTVNSGLATTKTYINKDITVIANSAMSGKKFAYWYVSDTTKLNLSEKTDINAATTIFNITGDVTVTATYVDSSTELYTLTVIAKNSLDSSMNAPNYTYTAKYPAGATQTVFPPTNYQSQFVRWEIYPTNSNTDKTYDYNMNYRFTMTSYDLTIEACYRDGGTGVIRTLTIDQEGANPDTYTEKYIAGDTVRVTAQSVSGYVFQYWSSDPLSDGTYVGFYQPTSSSTIFDMPDQDVRVIAVMEKDISKYNVSVYNGSGDGLYYVGDRVDITASPAEDGFIFLNWSTTSAITIDNVNATESFFYMIAEDVKITAIFIDENDQSNVYKVTVLSGEGTGLHTVTGNYLPGATVTISAQGSITDDRTFYQWISSTNSITLKNSLSSVTSFIMPAEDLVLTATYKYLPDHDYSIMVYNGESDPVGLAKENQVVTLTANSTPPTNGYVFSHWSSNSTNIVYNNNQASITEFIMPPEDVVITANYRDPNLVTYLATIHTHGAMAQNPTTIRYAEGDTVSIQAATAVDGMKFINWSSMNNVIFDDEFSESTKFKMPAYDVTVQANFSENSLDVYTATIINQQNGDYTTGRYISGTTVTIEAGAATSGAFNYWSSESNIEFADKTTMVTTFVMPEKDIVVKANYKSSWELIYRATVQNGDGDGDYAQGDTVTVSAKPTGDQVFSYWSVDDDSVTFVNKYRDTTTFKMPANDVKVVAHYEEGSSNEYTVTVTKGSGSGTYEPGDTVHLEANEEDGEVFSYWSVVSGTGVQIRSQYSRVTSFRMPDSEVRITAVYTNGTSGGDSSSNGSYDAPYTITTTVMGSGQIYPSGTVRAYQYGSQKFLMVPETGFETAIVLVDGKVVDATSEYTFSNITENHTINVVFRTASLNTNAPGTTGGTTTNVTNPFMDVTQADWFYDTIMDVYGKGIMSGTSATTFEPNTGASRAMVATVLYGLENAPVVTSHDVFTDITTSEWYTNGVIWCYQNNILSGYDDGTFKPTQLITREELCAILYRYGQYKNLDMTILGDINQFADSNSIATWAQTAVKWCIGNSLMSGRKIWEFDPKSQATRAEIAVVFSNATKLTNKFDR